MRTFVMKNDGHWIVKYLGSTVTLFKSLSRATAIEWKRATDLPAMQPLASAHILNTEIDAQVWQQRN